MSDIVERLRSGKSLGSPHTWTVTPTHMEAAGEIERLRARVAELGSDNEELVAQIDLSHRRGQEGGYPCTPEHTWAEWIEDRQKRITELMAENAKLREALKHYADPEASMMAKSWVRAQRTLADLYGKTIPEAPR